MSNNLKRGITAGLLAFGLGAVLANAGTPPTSPQGVITARGFLNIGGGTAVTDLTGSSKFTNNTPDFVVYYPYFEWNATGTLTTPPGDYADNYGDQMYGYFYPPSTGDYVFYIASDDGGALYLSTDTTPANKKLIAVEAGYSNKRSFTVIGGTSTVADKCSQTYAATQWPTKDPINGGAKITLTQGQPYYIEALHKEGGGGDGMAIAVQDPGFVIDATMPIPGDYLSSYDKNTGPVSITTQPASVAVTEGGPATFSVVVDGTPPFQYVWKKDGVDLGVTNIASSITIPRVYRADNGKTVTVTVTGAQGSPVTSTPATITVSNDTTPPTLVSVAPSMTFTTLTVSFSEPVDQATAETASNYGLSGGVTVSSAKLFAAAGTAGDNKVVLTTSKEAEGATLTLTVSNVKDVAGNVIAANSTLTFKTMVFVPGWAGYQRWDGDTAAIATFATAVLNGTQPPPNIDTAVTQFGGPWGVGDNYNSRVYGWFIPPSNGDYVFFVASDDQSNLYLSTDDTVANKKMIAQEAGWSNQYQWQTIGGGSLATDKRSDSFGAIEWPFGNTITLTANKRYYMEILQHEGGGGDGSDATYIKSGDADPPQSAAGMFLKGSVIGTFLDPNGASINIVTPPADTTAQEQRFATFTVVAGGTSAYGTNVTYQWQKAPPGSSTFTDIAGATKASYTTPLLTLADTGSKFQVVCSVPTYSQASSAATLTVVPDTFPPELVAVGSVMNGTNGTAIEIGLQFDENIDGATAIAANFSLSKGSITGVRFPKYAHTDGAPFFQVGSGGTFNGYAVVLTTSGLANGDSVTVTAKNLKDLKGNTMSATGESKTITVTSKMRWAAMGGDDYLQGASTNPTGITADPNLWVDDVVAYSDSDFDLISSGTGNWNNYDECTFVFEEVTGDFDKVVRVEYQDPMSQWARAGLCATPNADANISRDTVTGGYLMAKRFMMRANPAVQWDGTAGNNQNEYDYRQVDGGNYGGGGAGNPAYPNAWLRMQRSGQTFNALYSSDGVNWTSYGTFTFTDNPGTSELMPAKLLVGPYYSPEMNNNNTGPGVGHSSVAKFRQYGNFQANPPQVSFGLGLNFGADEANGTYSGTLPSIATAGVPGVVQANWNNLATLSGTTNNLTADALGSPQSTTASVTWTSANTWASTGPRGEENNKMTGNDLALMTGYLDTGAATTSSVEISGIPSQLTSKGYDVYVYALGGVAGRGGGYRVVNADTSVALTDYINAQGPANPTNYIEAVPTPGAWAVGDYMVFRNLTAAHITVEATTADGHGFSGTPRAPINAIQLVPTGGAQPPGKMTIAISGANITISWAGGGTLYSATAVNGPWTPVGTTKPYTTSATGAAMYFRVQQ